MSPLVTDDAVGSGEHVGYSSWAVLVLEGVEGWGGQSLQESEEQS